MRKCPKCGGNIPEGNKVCYNCGHTLLGKHVLLGECKDIHTGKTYGVPKKIIIPTVLFILLPFFAAFIEMYEEFNVMFEDVENLFDENYDDNTPDEDIYENEPITSCSGVCEGAHIYDKNNNMCICNDTTIYDLTFKEYVTNSSNLDDLKVYLFFNNKENDNYKEIIKFFDEYMFEVNNIKLRTYSTNNKFNKYKIEIIEQITNVTYENDTSYLIIGEEVIKGFDSTTQDKIRDAINKYKNNDYNITIEKYLNAVDFPGEFEEIIQDNKISNPRIINWKKDIISSNNILTILVNESEPETINYLTTVTNMSIKANYSYYWFDMNTLNDNDKKVILETLKFKTFDSTYPFTFITNNGNVINEQKGALEPERFENLLRAYGLYKSK